MLAKILFRPLGVFFGVFVAGKVGTKAFNSTWERRYGTKAPTALTEEATWPQVLGAAAVRGTFLAVSATAFNRAVAKGFRHVTGFWPGEHQPEPAARLEAKRR